MSERADTAIIGAGSSGISAGLALKDRGIEPLIIDEADTVGSSWRRRYDRLRLNTCRQFSHLPDRKFPKGTPINPTREQMIEHIERHASEDGLELSLGTRVERIDRSNGSWRISTSQGELTAPQVIVATGYDRVPFIPGWDGRERFRKELIHAADYRNPEPYVGKRVLVIGPGCSGMEIAYDLTRGGAAKVWLAVRTPPNIVLREGPGPISGDMVASALLHLPTRVADAIARFGRRKDVGDLSEQGLPVPEEGVFSRLRRLGVAPAIVDHEIIDAIKADEIEIVPGVESLSEDAVRLTGGGSLEPDAVICATGYRSGLESLVGHLGVLDGDGRPKAVGEQPAAEGLRFIGYVPRPSAIGFAAKQAKKAAQAIRRELRDSAAS